MSKMYLFKNSDGNWIFGPTVDSLSLSGVYKLDFDRHKKITIREIFNRNLALDSPVDYYNYLKLDGQGYSSFEDFYASTKLFFDGTIKTITVDGFGHPTGSPCRIDASNENTIYEGWKQGDSFIIKKTDLSNISDIKLIWAVGEWNERLTLNYQ